MNIKVGKKFILGDTQNGLSRCNSVQNTNRVLKSSLSSNQNEILSHRQKQNDLSLAMPIRDQINMLEVRKFINVIEYDQRIQFTINYLYIFQIIINIIQNLFFNYHLHKIMQTVLFDFETDLKESKQDMESIKKSFISISKKYNQEFDQLLDECSNKIKETGDKVYEVYQEVYDMQDTKMAEVLSLRYQYDDYIKFTKNLGIKSNVIEHDVGFKEVYKF